MVLPTLLATREPLSNGGLEMALEAGAPLELLDAHYEQMCAPDGECRQLLHHLKQAFSASILPNPDQAASVDCKSKLLKRFSGTIYPLVVSISRRLGTVAVHTLWLYCALRAVQFWARKLVSIEDGFQVLLYLVSAWHTFQDAINLIHSFSLYAEKAFAERHHSALSYGKINEKCCRIFMQYLLRALNSRLTVSILAVMQEAAEKEEHGEEQVVHTVRAVLSILSYIDDVIESSKESSAPHLYYRLFALPYLATLKRSRRPHPLAAASDSSQVIAYLRKVEHMIKEEKRSAKKYRFSEATSRMAAKLLYSLLIESQRHTICAYSVFEEMVADREKHSALRYLYQICQFDGESVKLLRGNIERLLSSQLEQLSLPQTFCTGEQVLASVEELQALYSRWLDHPSGLTCACFASSEEARQAILTTLATYLNTSPSNYCILSLSLHLASLASSCTFSPAKLDRILSMLILIHDKQAIAECAWYFLCNRIINQLSPDPSQDVAALSRVLDRLQIESPISGKLILDNFYSSLNRLKDPTFDKKYGHIFQIHVLNGLWKLDSDPTTQTFRLPRSFWTMYSCFHRKFAAANRKKILKLNRNYGCSEMCAHLNSGTQSYQFVLSLRQTVILLLFNQHDALSFEQIQNKCKLDVASLLQCIELFCKCKLLLKTEKEKDSSFEKSTFVVNDNFTPRPLLGTTGCKQMLDSTIQVNWIKLQHELCCSFDLRKIVAQCDGGHAEEKSKPPPKSEEEMPSELKSLNSAGLVKVKPPTGEPKVPSIKKGGKTESTSMADGRFRFEAAIIRVLKRATVVSNLETLRDLTLEALAHTKWRSSQLKGKGSASEKSSVPVSLPLTEMTKYVDSLEKNGYLRQLSTGDIVYEP